MTSKELPREQPGDPGVHLGAIEPMEGGPAYEALKAKLVGVIEQDPELKARVSMLANPHLTSEYLFQMVSSWNSGRPNLSGLLVEKRIEGHGGKSLTVKMDRDGNVSLKGINKGGK